MIFKETWQQVLDGTKTQTRRPVKEGEECHDYGRTVSKHWISRFTFMPTPGSRMLERTYMYPKYQVGRTYAVQPGRGKKAVGRIRITKIRRERLQEISPEDVIAEGFYGWNEVWSRSMHQYVGEHQTADVVGFMEVWDSLYRHPHRWEDNPEVWALEIEVLKEERCPNRS